MPIGINRRAERVRAAREQIPKHGARTAMVGHAELRLGMRCLAVLIFACLPAIAFAQDDAFDALLRDEILASDPAGNEYEELTLPKPQPLSADRSNSNPVPLLEILEPEAAPSRKRASNNRRSRSRNVVLETTASDRSGSMSPLDRLDDLRRRMNASEREEESNVQRIDGKIGRLRKLMEAKRKRAETKSISLETDKLTLPKPDVSPSDERPAFDSILSEAIAVTDKPVDRIALANNLFASGELALAQKIYESIDLNEVTEVQKVWIQYQMAGCFRRLDSSQEAQSLYRTVAASKAAPHWAKRARWWLNTMSSSARIKERQVKMVNTLVQLKEATDELLTDEDK